MQFKDWFQEQLYLEIFEPEEIDAFEPEDGRWDQSPEEDSSSHTFRFNVKSDPDKNCGYSDQSTPCYHVSISRDGYIDFGHSRTGTADRFGQRSGERRK